MIDFVTSSLLISSIENVFHLIQSRLYDIIISGKPEKPLNLETPWMDDAAGLPENALELLPKLVWKPTYQYAFYLQHLGD